MSQKSSHTALSLVPLYAAVDVGSNNVRMDLYGIDTDGNLKKVELSEKFSVACKLAQGMVEKKPAIKKDNLALAVKALAYFDTVLTHYKIEPANICTVMTAAIRAVQDTDQGKEDIRLLASAFHHRPYTIITGKEEAILVGEAINIVCSNRLKKNRGKESSMAFAAIGGGSLELGTINTEGTIKDAIALPYGIHPLRKNSHNKTSVTGKIIEHNLRKHYSKHTHDVLVVIGGNWRALGEAICKRQLPAAIHGKHIRLSLISAMHRKEKYYKSLGGRPQERAKYMRLSAAILWRVAKHFSAKKIVFLETTIRDSMADQMHALRTGKIKRPALGLERLFSPLAP